MRSQNRGWWSKIWIWCVDSTFSNLRWTNYVECWQMIWQEYGWKMWWSWLFRWKLLILDMWGIHNTIFDNMLHSDMVFSGIWYIMWTCPKEGWFITHIFSRIKMTCHVVLRFNKIWKILTSVQGFKLHVIFLHTLHMVLIQRMPHMVWSNALPLAHRLHTIKQPDQTVVLIRSIHSGRFLTLVCSFPTYTYYMWYICNLCHMICTGVHQLNALHMIHILDV